MVRGFRTFREFRESGEGIATNILADRLRKLEGAGIIRSRAEETDGRRLNYRLTEKGIDLAPVLLEMLLWGARHEAEGSLCGYVESIAARREEFLAEVRRRWRDDDRTPLLPAPRHAKGSRARGRRARPLTDVRRITSKKEN